MWSPAFEPGEKSLKAAKNCSLAIIFMAAANIIASVMDLVAKGSAANQAGAGAIQSLLAAVVIVVVFFDLIRIAFALWGRFLAVNKMRSGAFTAICWIITAASLLLAISSLVSGLNAGTVLTNIMISLFACFFMHAVKGASFG